MVFNAGPGAAASEAAATLADAATVTPWAAGHPMAVSVAPAPVTAMRNARVTVAATLLLLLLGERWRGVLL